MTTIEKLLDQATPQDSVAPSTAGLRRVLQRQRRVRAVSTATASFVALAAFGVFLSGQGNNSDTINVVTTEPQTIETVVTTPADPSTTDVSQPVRGEDVEAENGAAPVSVLNTLDGVLTSSDGVFVRRATTPNQLELVAAETAAEAMLLADGTVVFQRSDPDAPALAIGAIELTRGPLGTRSFTPPDGLLYELSDARIINGRTTLLVNSIVFPSNITTAKEQLLTIDADSGEITSLGVFGGWETGVIEARFLADGIALVQSAMEQRWIEVIELDGSPRFSQQDRAFRTFDIATGATEILEVVGENVEPDSPPTLRINELDLQTGEITEERTLDLVGVNFSSDFSCGAQLVDQSLLCAMDDGPHFAVDTLTGRTTMIEGITSGSLSLALPAL